MPLTAQQNASLKAYIDATPALSSQPTNSDGAFAIAAALNLLADPEWVVWRTSVTRDEITQSGFTWTEVDGLSVGKARIWDWMFENTSRAFNPAIANVRAGIVEVWSGTAGKLAVQAAVLAQCTRAATVGEKLLSTGTGTTATPAVMGFEGSLSYHDVETARAA